MKITPRFLVILVCAWCGLPLLGIVLHPVAYLHFWTQAPLNLVSVIARTALIAIGWGAYVRRDWVGRASIALAITWTAVVLLLAVFTPFGMLSITLAIRSIGSLFKDDAAITSIATLVTEFWSLLTWSWAAAIVSRRLRSAPADSPIGSRTFASDYTGENRLVYSGVALILSWLFVWPFVHDLASPLREVRPGTWITDAPHARVVLTTAQRQQASSTTLQAVAEINDEIVNILTGKAPAHSTRKDYGISSRYMATRRQTWELVCFAADQNISQIEVVFYDDRLRQEIGERKFFVH